MGDGIAIGWPALAALDASSACHGARSWRAVAHVPSAPHFTIQCNARKNGKNEHHDLQPHLQLSLFLKRPTRNRRPFHKLSIDHPITESLSEYGTASTYIATGTTQRSR